MDFFKVSEVSSKEGITVAPRFLVKRSEDLMVRGKSFYAVWDEAAGLWSTNEYDVARLVDDELQASRDKIGPMAQVRWMSNFSTNSWKNFKSFLSNVPDWSKPLDSKVIFQNTPVNRKDYASKRVPYPLEAGPIEAYDELMRTLYDPEERQKLEWAIGAIVSGDSKKIQKFMVLYGLSGSGKSTVLNIIQKLFEGYYTIFSAADLGAASNAFAMTPFRDNPLVAIDHDGNLSNIKENGLINSIVSHEELIINEKFKATYTSRVQAFLFVGTNKPVKITDSKSGLLRRLIDVHPSGRLVDEDRYHILVNQVDFELGAIAAHCLAVYRSMGAHFYSGYRPVKMMYETNLFYNFVEYNYDIFRTQDYVTLAQAWDLYKVFCAEANVKDPMQRHVFRAELATYFDEFHDRTTLSNGEQKRSVFVGFKADRFNERQTVKRSPYPLVLEATESLLDEMLANRPAQGYKTTEDGRDIPIKRWVDVTTTLSDINTKDLHYVKLPENHIVIDFDIRGDDGEKSRELNIAEASLWPPTYAEFSKSGAGIHLHYIYNGDTSELSSLYSPGVEVKVFTGDASLRRKLTNCNTIPVASLNSGLPIKEKKVIDFEGVKSERGLRALIEKNLRKEIHPNTKPSIDFIDKILRDAVKSGLRFDVRDMKPRVLAFANTSTNQAETCIKIVMQMQFENEGSIVVPEAPKYKDDRFVYFDVEVYPNLFMISWKYAGTDHVYRMYNPKPEEVGRLFEFKLVGFNCRRYDNHILYGRYLGYDNERLYELSQRLISGDRNAYFREAYNISFADIYDFTSEKKSLKKWQIELGLKHKEINIPWDQPVPESRWDEVGEYCDNDVITTEQVHEARMQDFVARELLSDLSGLPINATTRLHTGKIIFGDVKNPQAEFVYTDLSEMFPGYTYSFGKSEYRGEDPSEGGYVYAEPGMYENVAVLDVQSMHPNSMRALDIFGPYTKNFTDLVDARVAIKHGDYEAASKMLDGKLKPYLDNPANAKALSYALKIVINTVYGLTSARFENIFRDPRNKDNIVAKRGALFMIDLKHFVQERGFQVVHIKTDSIKIPNASPEIIEEIMKFGEQYGYIFEHEETYQRFCLVNDAVYIAKTSEGNWTPVGAQFAVPYVFKSLFSREPITTDDVKVTKSVRTAMYIDPDWDRAMALHNKETMRFVGKTGQFVPVVEGTPMAGMLLREHEGKFYSVAGTKGYIWLEADRAEEHLGTDKVDIKYFHDMCDDALKTIAAFGDPEAFLDPR